MAWEVTLCASADVDAKTGAGVSVSFTEAMKNSVGKQAEAYLDSLSGKKWVAAYSGLTAEKKYILTEYVSSSIAMYAIAYDMSGYTTRMEAETMLSLNWARIMKCEELLKQDQVKTFLETA